MAFETDKLAAANGRSWENESLTALIAFVQDTHHVYTRSAMAALPPFAAEARRGRGDVDSAVAAVEVLVRRLVEDLGPHLQKEEQILFPYVVALEAAARTGGRPDCCFGTVQNPIRMMMREHDAVGEILAALRATTGGYATPPDAGLPLHALYAGLKELDADLLRHIHLENDVLFPGALALEEGRLRPAVRA